MTILPASIRNLLARKKPAPPRCTPDNINALMGRNWTEAMEYDNLDVPSPSTKPDIARRGEGE